MACVFVRRGGVERVILGWPFVLSETGAFGTERPRVRLRLRAKSVTLHRKNDHPIFLLGSLSPARRVERQVAASNHGIKPEFLTYTE